MSRTPRVVAVGLPHHVTQRGNRGCDVFGSADDRQRYLGWLREYADRYGLKVWAYCLMMNHVHLIVVPTTETAMGQVFRALLMRHTRRLNADSDQQGHLWQARYHSCPMDEAHLYAAVRYVERSPVRAGLMMQASAYQWSSAAPHCGLRADAVLSPGLPLLKSVEDWESYLGGSEGEETVDLIRRRTLKGLPLGAPAFVERLGKLVGRVLVERGRGRPRTKAKRPPKKKA